MINNLENKSILFFAPAFFGYEQKMKKKMEEMGASVDLYDERSISSSLEKAFLKLNPNIFRKKTEKYYLDILNQNKNKKYDYVFFIKCEMVTENMLLKLKEYYSDSLFCLYMYDSLANIPNIKSKLKYFDYISSFDRQDCIENENIYFRPLFYSDEFKIPLNNEKLYKYDLCFIGTIHSDRYKIIKNIKEYADSNDLSMFVYPFLQSKFIYYFYKLTKKEFRNIKINDFKFDKISSTDISNTVNDSRVVIDIQHPKQTGLTMRTIEVLGMNKQLITTNKDIVNYDFYDSRNISVVNRDGTKIDLNDLDVEYNPINEDLYYKYSLECWVKEVLGGSVYE